MPDLGDENRPEVTPVLTGNSCCR